MKEIRSEEIDNLFCAINTLNTLDEFYAFFGDVCTINEVLDMAQRFSVAKMLDDGKSYVEISDKSGASSATTSRVNRCLKYSDGYKTALERMKSNENNAK